MQSLVLTDMDIIGIFLQNTFTGRQFVCKIQEREYLIYRRVYFAMKGGWIMSEKKLRNITDVLCFLMILGSVMYLVATWGNLPERVPIHFNAHGIPDRYGKKGSLLLEPILGLLILALLMFCQRFPQWWNYPVEVTEENREHIFEIASKMMSVIKLLSIGVCLDAGISGNLGTAPMWPVWILITGIFVTLILGIRVIYKAGKETGMDEDDKS